VVVSYGESSPRIALIGCGLWGRHVLRDLRELGCEVPVVARSAASVGRAIEGGASEVVPDVDALGAVDGVVVCTPTTTHAEVVERILHRDVPTFVTKPLSDDVDAARRLVREGGEHIHVMHVWRFHPGIVELARIAREAELGEVCGVHSTRVGWGNPHGDVDGVWMLAPHDLSILLEILGAIPEPRAATVERSAGIVTGLVGLLGDVEPWATIDVSIAHPVRRREVRLVCGDGVAVLPEAAADHLLIARGTLQRDVTRVDERRPIDRTMPLLLQLGAFVDHVRGGPSPRSSAQDGLAEVEAIARLRELARIEATEVAGAR
jgi:predicted dehydrogenase